MEQTLFTDVLLLGVLLLLLVAVVFDLLQHRIPNLLCIGFLLGGFALQVYTTGWEGVLTATAGSLSGLALFLPLYLAKGMGAGDVKMLAALGALFGPFNTLIAAAFTLIIGGLLAVSLLLMRSILVLSWQQMTAAVHSYITTLRLLIYTHKYYPPNTDFQGVAQLRFPYALAIAGGAITVLEQQSLLNFVYLKYLLGSELSTYSGAVL